MSKSILTQASKTYMSKSTIANQAKWHLIDATDLTLGRLAVRITTLIRGRHRPHFTPNMNCGDKVIVINAEKIHLTGKKRNSKIYYWHTGYPGGIKSRTASQILEGQYPERVLKLAVKRMLPDGPLSNKIIQNLFIYNGSKHPHVAQQPTFYDFAKHNNKNCKRY